MNKEEILNKFDELEEVEVLHKNDLKKPQEKSYKELNEMTVNYPDYCFDYIKLKTNEFATRILNAERNLLVVSFISYISEFFLLYGLWQSFDERSDATIITGIGASIIVLLTMFSFIEIYLIRKFRSLLRGKTSSKK